mmetsp:Transcript_69595/g.194499  ORF Transcript_69595/g.194499 Transcript_69595/m.194499 type:complete len:111 (-) Transcript_69595:62-394(-)
MPPIIDEPAYRKLTSRPIVKHADIVPQETAAEAVEVVTLALDKYIATKNYEAAAKVPSTTTTTVSPEPASAPSPPKPRESQLLRLPLLMIMRSLVLPGLNLRHAMQSLQL